MKINIDGMEFIFLFMGYGLGILEAGSSRGWLIVGIMLVAMVLQAIYRTDVIIKTNRGA